MSSDQSMGRIIKCDLCDRKSDVRSTTEEAERFACENGFVCVVITKPYGDGTTEANAHICHKCFTRISAVVLKQTKGDGPYR